MANGTLKVSNIQTSSGSGTITLGQSGETISVPSGGGTIEVDTMMGMAEYAPGSTSSVIYTPVFARTSASSGTFYINNSVTTSRMTFTLMEIA